MILQQNKTLKLKNIVLSALATVLLGATILFGGMVHAAPIPAGCPGSPLAGPPAPGVCESIPAGCPGSPLAGPPNPAVTCPYDAPANNSNSGGSSGTGGSLNSGNKQLTGDVCGAGAGAVHTSINIGCKGKGNAILDALFAIIRFLSIGVGLVIIGSIIVAGIQYTSSRGDPQATAKALSRITSTLAALLLFIFAYAILNWLVPAGILK